MLTTTQSVKKRGYKMSKVAIESQNINSSLAAVRLLAQVASDYSLADGETCKKMIGECLESLDILGCDAVAEAWDSIETWSVCYENGEVIETNLTESEAESVLCRCCNEDIDAYLVSPYSER